MVVACMAPGCTNRRIVKGLSFHRLPLNNEDKLKKWISAMKLKDPPVNKHCRLCSDHFLASDYQRDLRAELQGTKPKHLLIPEAVPSVFDFSRYVKATVNAVHTKLDRPRHRYVSTIGRLDRIAKREDNKTLKQDQQELPVFIKNEVSDEGVTSDVFLSTQSIKYESVPQHLDNCSFKSKEEYSIDELQNLDASTLVNLFTIRECLPKDKIKYKCQMLPGCFRCYTETSESQCKELISAHLLNHVESLVIRSNRNPTLYANMKIYPCLQKAVKEEVGVTAPNHELFVKESKLSDFQSSHILTETTANELTTRHATSSPQARFHNIMSLPAHEDKEVLKTTNAQSKSESADNFLHDVEHPVKHPPFRKTAPVTAKAKPSSQSADSVESIEPIPPIFTSSDEDDELSSSDFESESSDSDSATPIRSRFSMKQGRSFGNRTLSSTLRNRINLRRPIRRKAVKNDNGDILKLNINRGNKKKAISNCTTDESSCNRSPTVSPTQNRLVKILSSPNKDSTSGPISQRLSPEPCDNLLSINLNNIDDTIPFSNGVSSFHISETKTTSHDTAVFNNPATPSRAAEHGSPFQNLCQPTQPKVAPKLVASAKLRSHPLNNVTTSTRDKIVEDNIRRRYMPSILQRKSHSNKNSILAGKQAKSASERERSFLRNSSSEELDAEPHMVAEAPMMHAGTSFENVARNLASTLTETSGDAMTNAKKSRKQDLMKSMKEDDDEKSSTKEGILYSLQHDHCYCEAMWSSERNRSNLIKVTLPSRNVQSAGANPDIDPNGDSSSSKEGYKLIGPSSKQVEAATDPNIKAKAMRLISELRHRKPSEVMVCTERVLVQGKSAFIVQDFYSCEICGKRFTAPNSLYGHYRAHAGIKPYRCKVCGQKFTRSHSLAYHGMIHENTARFECEICKKKFRHPTHFKEHKHRHTGEEPYVCTDCPRRFKTRNTFRRHMLTKHQKKITPMGSLPNNSRIINFIRKPGVARSNASRAQPDNE